MNKMPHDCMLKTPRSMSDPLCALLGRSFISRGLTRVKIDHVWWLHCLHKFSAVFSPFPHKEQHLGPIFLLTPDKRNPPQPFTQISAFHKVFPFFFFFTSHSPLPCLILHSEISHSSSWCNDRLKIKWWRDDRQQGRCLAVHFSPQTR